MSYSVFKTIHIVIAAMMLTSLLYVCHSWFQNTNQNPYVLSRFAIIPLSLLQLITGFSMISIKQYDYHAFWILGSIMGFITLIIAWMILVCSKHKILQLTMMSIALMVILSMIFLMVNQSVIL